MANRSVPAPENTVRANTRITAAWVTMPTASAASGSVIIPKVRTDRLEQTVWREVCRLLAEPTRLAHEYQRRLEAVQGPAGEANTVVVDRQIAKLRQGIARLIDGYAEGYLDHAEAEPRIRRFKERLQRLEAQAEQWRDQAQQHVQLQLVIGRLEEFSTKVTTGLEQFDWAGRRELIRTLVKRVEIDQDSVNVVFRVDENRSLRRSTRLSNIVGACSNPSATVGGVTIRTVGIHVEPRYYICGPFLKLVIKMVI